MRNFVITSNRYSFLLEGYIDFFKKNWSDDYPIDTVILGYDEPNVSLSSDFTFHSMGRQQDCEVWAEPLVTFFESIDDDYFLLSFEDHYKIKKVNMKRLEEGIQLMELGGVDKLYLQPDYSDRIISHYSGNWYTSDDHQTSYTSTSLLPSIWKREFFIKLLRNTIDNRGVNCHKPMHFERINNNKSPLGCNTLLTKDVTIYACLDAVRKGKYSTSIFQNFSRNGSGGDRPWMQNLTPSDIEIFHKMYVKWENR